METPTEQYAVDYNYQLIDAAAHGNLDQIKEWVWLFS
jgi:hypothetical protein